MTAPSWTRPDTVPFPSVWSRFQGKKPMKDGKIPSFWIQDITDDLAEPVVDHMCDYFLRDEPLTSTLKLRDDPVSLQEIRQVWRDMIKQRAAIVALTEGENGPVIAGCNVTGIVCKKDKDKKTKYQGEQMKKVIDAMQYITDKVDFYERYGVEEYMDSLGLSVHPAFRGQGIGIELLKARFPLGRALGVKLTETVFSAIASQILAHRIGMEMLEEVFYKDYIVDGKVVFENLNVPSMKLMAKKITPGAED